MRKILMSLSLVSLTVLVGTACKKEYTCACTFSYQVDGQTVHDSGVYIEEYSSKSQANESCQDWEEIYLNQGATSSECVSSVN